MSVPRWDVPSTWVWCRASDIADIVGGGTPKSSNEANFSVEGIPWLTPADLTGYEGAYISQGRRSLSQQGYENSGASLLPAGSVLFSSRAPIGYCVIASNPIATNQGFKSWVIKDGISSEFVRHYLLSSKEYAESLASGTTFLELSGARVAELAFPLPPLAEQRRIVAKLDALDASAKRAHADLDRIPTLVARAKQAILAEVFRQASKSSKELVAIEELVREDAPICYGVVQPGDDKERGVPLVRVCDLVQGRVDWTAIRTVTPEIAAQYDRSRIKDGDVLVSVVGTIGRVAVAREVPPNCNIARAVARIRPKSERASSEWLSIALQAPQVQERFMADSREVARKTLNISLLKEVEIPDISIELQAEIVRRIETAFAKIDRIAAEAASARALLDRLNQAILAKAFCGELVPQDPSDEPAEKLLEKIKAARAAPPARKTRKKQP